MLFNSPQRLTYNTVRTYPLIYADRELLNKAWNNYETAFKAFTECNSDETMVTLIGTYARYSRVLYTLEDKYGA